MALVIIPAGQTTLPTIADNDSLLSQEGGQQLSGGTLDQSGLVTGLTNVTIGPQSGISTTPNEPLYATITGTLRNDGVGGVFYVRPVSTGSDGVANCIHSGFGTTHFVTGGEVVTVRCTNGSVQIDSAVIADNIYIGGGVRSEGSVVQGYNSTANLTWNVDRGRLNTERGLAGSGFVGPRGSVIVKRRNTNATRPTQTTGTLTVYGHLEWQGGDIATLQVFGDGKVDFSGVTSSITVTNCTMSVAARDRSILQSKHPGVTVTFTNPIALIDGLDEADGKSLNN